MNLTIIFDFDNDNEMDFNNVLNKLALKLYY